MGWDFAYSMFWDDVGEGGFHDEAGSNKARETGNLSTWKKRGEVRGMGCV